MIKKFQLSIIVIALIMFSSCRPAVETERLKLEQEDGFDNGSINEEIQTRERYLEQLVAKIEEIDSNQSEIKEQLTSIERALAEVAEEVSDDTHELSEKQEYNNDSTLVNESESLDYIPEGITDLQRSIIGSLSVEELIALNGDKIDGIYAEEFSIRLGQLYNDMSFDDFVDDLLVYNDDEIDELCMFLNYNLAYFRMEPERLRDRIEEYNSEYGSNTVTERLEHYLIELSGY